MTLMSSKDQAVSLIHRIMVDNMHESRKDVAGKVYEGLLAMYDQEIAQRIDRTMIKNAETHAYEDYGTD